MCNTLVDKRDLVMMTKPNPCCNILMQTCQSCHMFALLLTNLCDFSVICVAKVSGYTASLHTLFIRSEEPHRFWFALSAGIKAIKLYAWEQSFKERILSLHLQCWYGRCIVPPMRLMSHHSTHPIVQAVASCAAYLPAVALCLVLCTPCNAHHSIMYLAMRNILSYILQYSTLHCISHNAQYSMTYLTNCRYSTGKTWTWC